MKKTVNECTDQPLAQNSEIFIIKKRKIGKKCRGKKKEKEKSPFTVYRDGKTITAIALENINVGLIK